MAKGKPNALTLADVEPGCIAETACATLLVTGQVKGGTLVELYDPVEQRRRSSTFGAHSDIVVTKVTNRTPIVPTAGGAGCEVDPVKG